MTGALIIRRENRDTHTRTHSRTHTQGEGHVTTEADWSDASTSQGMSRIAGSNQKLGERLRTDARSEPLKETKATKPLISNV